MKKYIKKVISLFLSATMIISLTSIIAIAQNEYSESKITTSYYYLNKKELCSSEISYHQEDNKYYITISLQSIHDYTYILTVDKYYHFVQFENSQEGLRQVNSQNLWNALGTNIIAVYKNIFNCDFQGRTAQGIGKELKIHYWVYRNSKIADELFPGKDIRFHSSITDIGRIATADDDVSNPLMFDSNAYVFENDESDFYSLMLFCRDIYHISFADFILTYIYSVFNNDFWVMISDIINAIG